MILIYYYTGKFYWFPCSGIKMLNGGGWVVIGGRERERYARARKREN